MKSWTKKKKLQQAYADLFGGGNEQGEMILENLAEKAGLLMELDPGHASELLQHYGGRRAMVLHILHMGRRSRSRLELHEVERTMDWDPGAEREAG